MKHLILFFLICTSLVKITSVNGQIITISGPTSANINETKIYTIAPNNINATSVTWTATGGVLQSQSFSDTEVVWTKVLSGNKVTCFVQDEFGDSYLGVLNVNVAVPIPNTSYTIVQNCGNSIVQRNSVPSTDYEWFWQVSAMGTQTDLGSSSSISRLTSGNLYLRARTKLSPFKWSTASQHVGNISVITSAPSPGSISAQYPSICSGQPAGTLSNLTSASGTFTYEWVRSADGMNWTPVGGESGENYSPGILTNSTYFARRAYNVCGSVLSNSLHIIVKPIPTVALSAANQEICSGVPMSGVTISNPNLVSGTTYSWTVSAPNINGASASSGASISQTLSQTTSVNQTAIYTITPTANGCPGNSITHTVTVKPNPTPANAGLDQTGPSTCGLTSVTLAGNAPAVGTGVWSILNGTGGSFGNTTNPTTTFNGVAGSTYTLRWTISNNPCAASTDDVVITFNRNPTVANAGPDQTGVTTCGLTSITLSGNTPSIGAGVWSIISGVGGTFGSASNPSSAFSGVAGNTYTLRWTITNGSCTASFDDVEIKFNAASSGGIVSSNAEAYGTANGVLTLSDNNGTVQKWQQKLGSADWTDISNNTTSLPYNISNTTLYRAVVKNGVCVNVNSTEAEIIVNPLPGLIVNGMTAIAPSASTQLTTLQSYYSYQWYKNSIAIPGANTSTYTVTEPGLYKVALKARSNSPTYVTEEADIKRTLDAPLQDMNYVRSTSFAVSGVNEATDIYQLNPKDYAISTTYFDGLGRPVQSVALGAAGNGNDLITPIEYDAFGREAKKYLPYAHANRDGRYQPTALTSQGIFYNNTNDKVADDIAPYSQTIFEPSPLNRVIKQGAPGHAWQPDPEDKSYNSTDHSVKFSYEFNQANEVLQWTFTYPTEEYTTTALNAFGKVEAGTATAPVFYSANQLYKNKTKDEQGNQVIEYVDKEGRTVLKRVQVVTGNSSTTDTNRDTNWASTYYIYDDFGNLVCVIPPEASKRLPAQYYQGGTSENIKDSFLKRWAFRYRYDARQRMIMKQVPGAEPVYMVYDDRDRLVMTQDGNQRGAYGRPWTFTKYDAMNRPIATGIKDTFNTVVLTQSQMQSLVDLFYTKSASSYYEDFIGNTSDNIHGYTNNSFPTTNSGLNPSGAILDPNYYLTITYYDDYSIASNWGPEYQYSDLNLVATNDGINYPQPDSPNNRVKGQVTATKTKVLNGSNRWMKSVTYYDDKYRVIQVSTDNYKGGIDRQTQVIDFVGKTLLTKTTHYTFWKDLVGVETSGNSLIKKNLPASWSNAGAASIAKLKAGQDGWMEVTVSETNTNRMIGFSDVNTNAHYNTIDYAVYLVLNQLSVYENGSSKGNVATIVTGDVIRIERISETIKYFKNNTLVYTSLTPSTTDLLIDASLNQPNSSLTNVRASFSSPTQSIQRRFDYDHAGRLINTWHKFNDQPEILLAHNEYNELGQLIDKKLHVSSPVGGGQEVAKQSVDYAYNIRGWLTNINDAALIPQAGESKDYFGMELAYNTDLGTGNPSDKLQFNGNINAMKWSNNQGLGDQKENAYNFTYDPLNRLKTADFKQKDASSWGLAKYRDANGMMQSVDAFNESIMNGSLSGYDLNGNIQFLKRTGQNGQLIDNLVYSQGTWTDVQSNKLVRVTDSANDSEGFKETYNGIDDYGYDSNGNLYFDHNKATAELIKNGTFDNGQAEWTITEASRFSFVNGRVYVSAGTNTGILTQPVSFRTGSSTIHMVTINLIRTSANGAVNIRFGNGTWNTNTSVSGSMQMWYASGSQVVKLEILPEFEGYIEDISVRASTQMTYNYLNLPETVTRGNDGSIRYIYTATGQKLAQVVTEGTKTKTTDYVGEYVYENDTLLFVNHEEGRLSLSSTSPLSSGEGQGGEAQAEYQYHLKDHLGNVRLTFTTKEETEATLATLETTNENEERGNFLKYDDIRKVNSRLFDHTHAPGAGTTHYAIRLSGTAEETYGLARSIAVMPGDVISAEVFAKYVDLSQPDVTTALEDFIGAIVAGSTTPGTIIDGGGYGSPGAGTIPYGNLLNKAEEGPGAPKAYLNWIVFDKNFVPLTGANKSGFRRISSAAMENGELAPEGVLHEKLESPLIEIDEPGYVYIYLSNEEAGTEVYFDDFKVTHTKSPVIQSDDYYPFGMTFNSYSRENSTKNRYLYNQGTGEITFKTERITDLELNVDMSRDRTYDYLTGRWWQVDPKADEAGQESWSTYQYGFDNPVRYNDPYGDCIPCLTAALATKYSALMASMKSSSSQGAVTRLMTNSSSTVQQRSGTNSPVTPVDNKAMAKIGDAKIVTGVTAKNTKTLTNEVSKDGLAAAKAVGTGLELTGVGAPVGAAINTTANVLDEARQVTLEGKPVSEAGTDLLIGGTIDATFSGLGNAAKSTVKQSEAGKEAFDKTVDGYSFSFSNLFQWVADKIQGNESEKKNK